LLSGLACVGAVSDVVAHWTVRISRTGARR
jgi:hypothetical protein